MPLPPIPDGLHISVSQLKCFLRCPRQYELKYVLGVQPAFVPVPFAFGLAFHGAAAALYSELKATGGLPSREMLADTFRDAWRRSSEGPLPLQADEDEPVDAGAVTDKGIEMVGVLYTHVATSINGHVVEGVEVPFVVELHDPDTGEVLDEQLVGTMDLVIRQRDQRTVVELKTAARKWSGDQLVYDLQPTGYKFAAKQAGLGDVRLRLDVVTKAKTPQVQVAEVERGPQDEEDFLRTARGVLRAVDAGVAYPVRGWQCKGCQFANACKPKRPKLALVA